MWKCLWRAAAKHQHIACIIFFPYFFLYYTISTLLFSASAQCTTTPQYAQLCQQQQPRGLLRGVPGLHCGHCRPFLPTGLLYIALELETDDESSSSSSSRENPPRVTNQPRRFGQQSDAKNSCCWARSRDTCTGCPTNNAHISYVVFPEEPHRPNLYAAMYSQFGVCKLIDLGVLFCDPRP